jgi:Ca2+-binding EF-hand superfamily protein
MQEKTGFTEDQLADFQEAFLLFDTKGDSKIPVGLQHR